MPVLPRMILLLVQNTYNPNQDNILFTMVSSLTTYLLVAAALLTKVGAFVPLQSIVSNQSVRQKSSSPSQSQLNMNMNLGAITGAVTGGLFAGSLHAIAGTLL